MHRVDDAPENWEVRRLRTVAEMRVSNVDKHTKDDELPVRLCNYVDVYQNDHITPKIPFMRATASAEEIERFRLKRGDVLITKDSETWDDIGVPALVTDPTDDLICGYHLAMLRPQEEILGPYLAWALHSKTVAYQFHTEAKGVTRFGLTQSAIQSVRIPLPSLHEQETISRFLDHADEQIQCYIASKERLIALLEEAAAGTGPPRPSRGAWTPASGSRSPGSSGWEIGSGALEGRADSGNAAFGVHGLWQLPSWKSASHSGAIPLLTMGNLRGYDKS